MVDDPTARQRQLRELEAKVREIDFAWADFARGQAVKLREVRELIRKIRDEREVPKT
jgi:hypothetical protein